MVGVVGSRSVMYAVEVHERGPFGWRHVGDSDPLFSMSSEAKRYADSILHLAVLDGAQVIIRVLSHTNGECVYEVRSSVLPSLN